jgi:hypothetical protein
MECAGRFIPEKAVERPLMKFCKKFGEIMLAKQIRILDNANNSNDPFTVSCSGVVSSILLHWWISSAAHLKCDPRFFLPFSDIV